MKRFLTKKTLIITLAAIFIFGAFLIFALLQKVASPAANEQVYQQTALATIFAPTEYPPVVTLKSAQANSNTLEFTLAISGLELVKNSDDLENIVCDPSLQIVPPVQWTTEYRESEIPEKAGDPIVITYKYGIEAKNYQSLSVEMDFTLGPCGLSGFQESNLTPYPRVDLIANYKLAFAIPIK